MELMGVTKVSNQGQITLPIKIRRNLNLKNRSIYIYETRSSVLISPNLFTPVEPEEAGYLHEEERQKKLDQKLREEGEEFV